MTRTFTERFRVQLREELLDAAAAAVLDGGWQQLRMQAIADQVGVSRRTVYNEFGNKKRLAEAIVLRVTERFVGDVVAVLVAAPDLLTGWERAALESLRAAQSDPLLPVVLTGSASKDFLPLLTSEGAPVIDYAATRLTDATLGRWPDLQPEPVRLAADATVRLILSHIVRPGACIQRVSRDIAELVTVYIVHANPAT
jgi:AcrR family transcriptional regulator